MLGGNHGYRSLPGLPLVAGDHQERLEQAAVLGPRAAVGRNMGHAADDDQPPIAEDADPLGPGRVFFWVQQHFGLAPGLGTVRGSLEVTGLGQFGIVRQVLPPDAADDGSVGQSRLGLAGDAVHAGFEGVGADLLPGLPRIGRTEMNVSQIEARHVVAGLALGRPRELVPHVLGGLRPSLDGPGRLREADHHAAVRHRPGADPACEAGRLGRVIDGLTRVSDGRERAAFGFRRKRRARRDCCAKQHSREADAET